MPFLIQNAYQLSKTSHFDNKLRIHMPPCHTTQKVKKAAKKDLPPQSTQFNDLQNITH